MTSAQISKTSMLIVDDDQTFADVLSRAMRNRDYAVHTAYTTEQAQALITQLTFDRAVIDLKIDQESGLTLIPALKNNNSDMEIIILTGYSSIPTAVEAIKLGAKNYLCKPADTEEILNAFNSTYDGNPHTELSNDRPSVDRLEWEHIQKVLMENNGNISATARSLGMHRRTLQRKLQKRPVKR